MPMLSTQCNYVTSVLDDRARQRQKVNTEQYIDRLARYNLQQIYKTFAVILDSYKISIYTFDLTKQCYIFVNRTFDKDHQT